jgi:hypothetical protein
MKWFAWSVSVVFILLAFVPTVTAQTDDTTSLISVDLQPQFTDANSTKANLMDETTVVLEKDIMISELQGVEGKYYGPYLQSSLFQFNHGGRYFQFFTNFTIGPEVIMNGASTFWVRVPIISSQYQQWHVYCSWGYYDYVEGNWASRSMGGPQLPWAGWPLGALGSHMHSIPELSYWQAGYSVGSGNVWKVDSANGDTYQILNRDTGLYIEYKGVFHSNELFTICFTGLLKENEYPRVFLSQERPDLTTNQTFYFYDIYRVTDNLASGLSQGFKYRATEDLPISAAWAFLFINGIGKEGLLSYKLKFRDNTTDYIEWGTEDGMAGTYYPYWDHTSGYLNNTHLSFYMPFAAQLYGGGSVSGQNSIDWAVHISLGYGYDYSVTSGSQMYFDRSPYGLANVTSLDLTIKSTENYILFSTPYEVTPVIPHSPPLEIDDLYVHIRLTPLNPCDIILLGADQGATEENGLVSIPGWPKDTMWASYFHENELMVYPAGWQANRHLLPLYVNIHWTPGIWAQLNETKLYWVYNFGWGVGYHFPGSTRIYLFTDTGGQYFYNGSLASFVGNMTGKTTTPWYQEMWDKLVKFIRDIAGYIWDGLQYIWNTLVNLGQWIWNTVSSIVGWIIDIIKDIANKVSHVIEGMLYGMPILVILFVVNYVGEALYKGHIPKLTKERRLLRKMGPRAILRQRDKYRTRLRKLKYPIVQAQKAQRDVRAWRTQRSERRTAKYESSIHRSRQKELKYQEEKASRLRRR